MEIGEKLITLLTCYYYAIILYDHTYILYEVLHWGLINEDITHLKGIALNLNFQWNYSTSVIIF